MTVRKPRRKLSDDLRDFARSEAMYAALGGVPVRPEIVESMAQLEAIPLPDKRARKEKAKTPEGEVQSAMVKYLMAHPRVRGLKRVNSGRAHEGSRRIEYNHVYGKFRDEWMNALDLEFWMIAPLEVCEVEVKAPGWRGPNMNDKTERGQYFRIEYVKANGGISGFCRSVQELMELLGE